MALNIKNLEVESLASEVARLSGTTRTEAIRQALMDRRDTLAAGSTDSARGDRLRQFLELRVLPTLPAKARRRWSKEEEARHLGYGGSGEPVGFWIRPRSLR
jgi:antitoxin VapB